MTTDWGDRKFLALLPNFTSNFLWLSRFPGSNAPTLPGFMAPWVDKTQIILFLYKLMFWELCLCLCTLQGIYKDSILKIVHNNKIFVQFFKNSWKNWKQAGAELGLSFRWDLLEPNRLYFGFGLSLIAVLVSTNVASQLLFS